MVIAYIDRGNLSVALATRQVRDAFHNEEESQPEIETVGQSPDCLSRGSSYAVPQCHDAVTQG